MIHPLFTQFNEDLGNRLNAGRPTEDFATYGETVIEDVAGAVRANGTAEDPEFYAKTVEHRFSRTFCLTRWERRLASLCGMERKIVSDNAPDVMFSIAANTPVRLGIGKESVTSKPTQTFPYVPAVPQAAREVLQAEFASPP